MEKIKYLVRYNKNGEKIVQKEFTKKETALNFSKIKLAKGYKVSVNRKG